MRRIMLATVFCLSATMFLYGQSQLKAPGFRGITWGTHVDSVYVDGMQKNFVQVKGNNDPALPNMYVLEDDEMHIGTVRLNNIYYYFNEEGFFHKVRIKGKQEDFADMIFILKHKFGRPTREDDSDGMHTLEWRVDNVGFTLAGRPTNSEFTLLIVSDWEAMQAYRKNTRVDDF